MGSKPYCSRKASGVISLVVVRPMRVDTNLTVVASVTSWRESLVPGDDHRRPSGGGVLHRNGSNEIVGLPAVQLIHGDVHGRQHFLQQRHLAGQLVGHPLPLGLIALVGQMPEGGEPSGQK